MAAKKHKKAAGRRRRRREPSYEIKTMGQAIAAIWFVSRLLKDSDLTIVRRDAMPAVDEIGGPRDWAYGP